MFLKHRFAIPDPLMDPYKVGGSIGNGCLFETISSFFTHIEQRNLIGSEGDAYLSPPSGDILATCLGEA